MFRSHSSDVLVVGAGPVGLLTAVALAERGVSVQIIDEAWRTTAHSYALALHPDSLRLLEDLGLIGELLPHGVRVRKVVFFDGAEPRSEARVSDLSTPYPFVLVTPQDTLERLLERRLEKLGVRVQWNSRLAALSPGEDRVLASIEELERASGGYAVSTTAVSVRKHVSHRAAFVVGADGNTSTVRRLLDIECEFIGPIQTFAVYEFQAQLETASEVRVTFDGERTNLMWPLPHDNCRWSFELDRDALEFDRVKERLGTPIAGENEALLSRDQLTAFLDERAPWFSAAPGHLHWSALVPFRRQIAAAWGRGRCWLVGDAGHMTGPVGVQSMNVGFLEAVNLAGRLTEILKHKAPLDDLADYDRERRREWRRLLGLTGRIVAAEGADPWAARHAERILPCLPGSRADLDALLAQFGLKCVE